MQSSPSNRWVWWPLARSTPFLGIYFGFLLICFKGIIIFLYSADHRFGFGPFLTFTLLYLASITSWFIIFYFCGGFLCFHSFRNIFFFSFKSSFKPGMPSPVAVGLGFSIIKEEVLEHNYNKFISYHYSDKTHTYLKFSPQLFSGL